MNEGKQLMLNFKPLDKLGKWPTQTYLQRRLAMLKLEQARELLIPKVKGQNENE